MARESVLGLAAAETGRKQQQNNIKTGRKRFAVWTLFCTWLSELALRKGSRGHYPHECQEAEVFHPITPTFTSISGLVSVVRAHGPKWLVLTGLGSSADLEIAECLT